jgi:hypothetical protein
VVSPLSTAGHRPLQFLFISLLPAVLRKSSLHLASGRPKLCLPRRGLHSRTRLPELLLVLRLIWPAHCHFSMRIRCAMSVTLVVCRITSFRVPQRNPEHSSFHSSLRDLKLVDQPYHVSITCHELNIYSHMAHRSPPFLKRKH